MSMIRLRQALGGQAVDAVVAAAQAHAPAAGDRVVIAVVDPWGHLLSLSRTANAQIASDAVAISKARTAAIFVRPSREIEEQVSAGRLGALALHGAAALTGGIPLRVGAEVVGAIGTSGETPDGDEQVSLAGAAVALSTTPVPARTADGARCIAEAAAAEATARGVAPVVAVVDAGGELLHLWRPDAAQVASVGVATDKARTAAIYRRPARTSKIRPPTGRPSALVGRRLRVGRDRRRGYPSCSVACGGVAIMSAPTIPRPSHLLPGRPDAVIDLQTDEGAALVAGRWRFAPTRVEEIDFVDVGPDLGPSGPPNRTYDVKPHAEGVDYDDSGWRQLTPADTQLRLSTGRVCFAWYRIAVTLPERVGDLPVQGATVVFEVVVDDYAEVWVDGALPLAICTVGGQVVAGFNALNRVVLTRDARPGQTFTIAVCGINGPISVSPHNNIWMRTSTLDFGRDPPDRSGRPASRPDPAA